MSAATANEEPIRFHKYGRAVDGSYEGSLLFPSSIAIQERLRLALLSPEEFATGQRRAPLTKPWHERALITVGRWVRNATYPLRLSVVRWLEWDDINDYEGDD